MRDDIKTWVANNLRKKVDKEDGKGLSSNDFTTEEKEKLAALNGSSDDVYVQAEEPVDAPEGSVWIDLDENGGIGLESGIVPGVTTADNGKMLQVLNGAYCLVDIEDSAIKTYIDNYINEALGGDY